MKRFIDLTKIYSEKNLKFAKHVSLKKFASIDFLYKITSCMMPLALAGCPHMTHQYHTEGLRCCVSTNPVLQLAPVSPTLGWRHVQSAVKGPVYLASIIFHFSYLSRSDWCFYQCSLLKIRKDRDTNTIFFHQIFVLIVVSRLEHSQRK